MKKWHFVFAAIAIGLTEVCGARLGRFLRRIHLL
jgi:hypothetical protein